MKTKTTKTNAKWSKLCRNVQSWYQIAEEMKLYCCQKERKLTAVTEQRDRLAEALRECLEDSMELLGERDWWKDEPRLDYQKRYQETRDNVTRADEALQSLTPNEL